MMALAIMPLPATTSSSIEGGSGLGLEGASGIELMDIEAREMHCGNVNDGDDDDAMLPSGDKFTQPRQ